MGERSISLSLSIAVLAVGVLVWVGPAGALPWEGPTSGRYPHLRVPMRDGDDDLDAVEIQFSQVPAYTMTIHGDGKAQIVLEFNADQLGTFDFQVPRASIERFLDALERLDYLRADSTLSFGCSLEIRHRLRLSVAGRTRQITMPARTDSIAWSSKAHETFWHEFEALVARIKEDCNVNQWVGSGGRL